MEKNNVIKTGGCRIKTFLPMLGYSNSMFSSKVFLKPPVFNIICTFLTLLGSTQCAQAQHLHWSVSSNIETQGTWCYKSTLTPSSYFTFVYRTGSLYSKIGKNSAYHVVEQLAAQKNMKWNFSLNFAPSEKNSL